MLHTYCSLKRVLSAYFFTKSVVILPFAEVCVAILLFSKMCVVILPFAEVCVVILLFSKMCFVILLFVEKAVRLHNSLSHFLEPLILILIMSVYVESLFEI